MAILLGVESILSIPVLFIFGIEGWNMSMAIRERKGRREQVGLLLQNRRAGKFLSYRSFCLRQAHFL